MTMPLMDEARALSLTRISSSIFLRSVMSTNEHIMHTGSFDSLRTRLAESRTVTGEPSFRLPFTSPAQSPLASTVSMISRASLSDSANTVTGLPMISAGSVPPHILTAARFT
ncbi:MAG: hypothetical protein BWZ01_02629 [Deltaproteobacteria bacterium ADurb.BinA179]|nr:MAG: hypothetical protein BWZ01_02629 [Deltaproteobacteria bacterium ADurb.BinA179]